MKNKYIAIIVTTIFLLSCYSSSNAFSIKQENQNISYEKETKDQPLKLEFSETANDASTLDITGIIPKLKAYSSNSSFVQTKKVSFSPSDCEIHPRGKGFVYLDINGLEPYGSPGEPMIPMKTFIFEIPKNSEIVNIGLENVYYKEINNFLRITPGSKPYILSDEENEDFDELDFNIKTYNSDSYYPGTALSYTVGKNRDKIVVIVQFFPLQYTPRSGKSILITDAQIKVYYNEESDQSEIFYKSFNAENIIITHPDLVDEANDLKAFHDSNSINTEVVTTTWIDNNYYEASDPPYDGYKDVKLKDKLIIRNYDYNLAKKIISYLGDNANHINLNYVTILGTARLVPPSYYYHESGGIFSDNDEKYHWVPTDYFYSSPDYDLVPNYYIGRIPVNDKDQADHVINKIKNWDGNTDLFRNVTLSGGHLAETFYYLGEFMSVDAINKGYFNGANIEKQFETDGLFTKEKFLESLRGDTGIIYNNAHGNGKVMAFSNDELLYANEILTLPSSDKTPLVISLSCSNGLFDTHITNYKFDVSFGESVLLSDAGGITYIGSSRLSVVGWLLSIENGELKLLKTSYMGDVINRVLKCYHEGGATLGNITTNALFEFVQQNNMADYINEYTFFSFVTLGDPALKIPERPIGESSRIPKTTAENPVHMLKLGENGSIPISSYGEKLRVKSNTNSSNVEVKFLNSSVEKNTKFKEFFVSTVDGNTTFNFTTNSTGLFNIRTVTEDGKESWFYVYVFRVVDDDYDSSTPGFGKTKFNKIQDAINHSNNGNISGDGIFVINGIYNENIKIDKAITLVGENRENTIVDGQNKNSVINIESALSEILITGFTIKNSGDQDTDAGINIKLDGVGIVDVYNNIITNNNIGIRVKNPKIIAVIYIQFNNITNNEYGVYSSNKIILCICFIAFNNILKNRYAVYSYESRIDAIMCNNIIENTYGVFLKKSTGCRILANNFIDNSYHATFVKSRKNIWLENYWDSRLGLKLKFLMKFPKIIFGRRGLVLGLIPSVDIDLIPSPEPIDFNALLS